MNPSDTERRSGWLRGYGAGFGLLRETRPEFWVLQLVIILEAFARFSFISIEALVLEEELGVAVERVNALLGLAAATTVVSVFLVGPFIDWLGIRRSLLVAFGVLLARDIFIVAAAFVPGMPGREVLIPGAWVATGPFLAMIPVGCFVAQKRFSSRRARATGYYVGVVAVNIGAFFAPFLASNSFHSARTRLGVCVACLLLTGICLFLVSRFVRSEEQHRGPDEESELVAPAPRRDPLTTIKRVLTTSAFWKIVALNASLTTTRCAFLAMALLLPKYLQRTVGPDTDSLAAHAVNVGIATFGLLALVPVVHRWRTYPAICFGSLVVSASMFLLALPLTGEAIYPAVILWMILLSIGELVYAPRISEYIATVAPIGSEGTYYSLSGAPWPAMKVFAAAMAGYLLVRWIPMPPPDEPLLLRESMEAGEIGYWDSPSALWLVVAGFAMIGPILLIVLRRWFTAGTWFELPPGERR